MEGSDWQNEDIAYTQRVIEPSEAMPSDIVPCLEIPVVSNILIAAADRTRPDSRHDAI